MSEKPEKPVADSVGPEPSKSVAKRGRVFGDAEIARILQTAADLQERADARTTGTGHGLTLDDLRKVAQEAGIDPEFVDVAVAQARGPVGKRGGAILGGPHSWRFHAEVPGELSEGDRARLVQAVRSIMDEQGEVAEVYGRLEWRYDDSLGPVTIGITPGSGGTGIDVSANRGGEAGALYGLGVSFGGLGGGAAVAGMFGLVGTAAAPLAVGAMAGVSYGLIRLGWRLRSRWWERRLQRRVDEISSTVQDLVAAREDDERG
jgi:hypothetical protein